MAGQLQKLLERNAYGEDLSESERCIARALITIAPKQDKHCWLCGWPAVYDTGLCRAHAFYALARRK